MQDINKLAENIIYFLQEFTGINIERDIVLKSSFSGTIGQYDIQKQLLAVYSFYKQQDYETCYHKSVDLIKSFIKSIEISDPDTQIDTFLLYD